jgi:thymidylate kinase
VAAIIEFVGLPGAGKSFMAERIARELERAGIAVLPLPRPTWQAKLAASTKHRGPLWVAVLCMARSSRPLRQRIQALRFLLVTLARMEIAACDRSSGVYIFDEGMLQRLFMLFVEPTGIAPGSWERYIAASPVGAVTIHITTPAALAVSRIARRLRGAPERFEKLSDAQLESVFSDAEQFLRTVTSSVAAPTDNGRHATTLLVDPDPQEVTDRMVALTCPGGPPHL